MLRSFIPFTLAFTGLCLVFYAAISPLFEWQISEVVTDFPSSYKFQMLNSPWRAYLGDSLDEKQYVVENISVLENGKGCSESNLIIFVNRSLKDKLLERLSLTRLFDYQLVTGWFLIEFVLSVAFSLWFTIWQEHRPVSHTTIFTMVATICFCLVFAQVMHGWGPRIGNLFNNSLANCHGTITFNAGLSKIYYSTAILWFTAMLAELAALVIMVRQIMIAVSKRRKSLKPVMS